MIEMPTALACTACCDVAGTFPVVVSVDTDEDARLVEDVTAFRCARRGSIQLPGVFSVRWLAYAAIKGIDVRWVNGDRWRPRAVTARHGLLLCEMHAVSRM